MAAKQAFNKKPYGLSSFSSSVSNRSIAFLWIKNNYLPLILEFASIAEKDFVQKVFLIHKKAIDLLLTELEKEDNPYGFLLKACLDDK